MKSAQASVALSWHYGQITGRHFKQHHSAAIPASHTLFTCCCCWLEQNTIVSDGVKGLCLMTHFSFFPMHRPGYGRLNPQWVAPYRGTFLESGTPNQTSHNMSLTHQTGIWKGESVANKANKSKNNRTGGLVWLTRKVEHGPGMVNQERKNNNNW